MRIDKRLNLIVPVYRDEEGSEVVAYVHSTPLAEETVDRYFMTLGQTYSTIFSQQLGLAAGPAHAMRVLRHTAQERGAWADGPNGELGVERGLVEEMRRLTNVLVAAREGDEVRWNAVPLATAVQQGAISPEDKAEVENAIAFFIAASATLGRAQRPPLLKAAAELWGARISSSTFMEFASSLRTSTEIASSGKTSPAAASEGSAPATARTAAKRQSVPV